MGYPMDLFLKDQHIDEFKCSICHEVLKDATMTEGCEHAFCTSCIQAWMAASNTCPTCRETITELRALFRPYLNLYASLKLKCCFDGCDQVFDLGQIEQHYKCCERNPDADKVCTGSCGFNIKMKDIPNHDCCEYLKNKLQERDLTIAELKEEITLKTTSLEEKDNEIILIRTRNIEIIRYKDKEYSDKLERKNVEIKDIKKRQETVIRWKDNELSDLLKRKNDEIENIKKEHVEVLRSKDKLIEELKTSAKATKPCLFCDTSLVPEEEDAPNNSLDDDSPAPASRANRRRFFGFMKD